MSSISFNLFSAMILGIFSGWSSGMILIASQELFKKSEKNKILKILCVSLLGLIFVFLITLLWVITFNLFSS